MNMQNTKKLATALLIGALMLGASVGASAAEPSNGSDDAVSATTMKAIAVVPSTVAEKGQEKQELHLTRIDGESVDGLEISIVPLTAIVDSTEANAGDGEAAIAATPLVPAKVVPMEKIVME